MSLLMVPTHSPTKRQRPPLAQALDACRALCLKGPSSPPPGVPQRVLYFQAVVRACVSLVLSATMRSNSSVHKHLMRRRRRVCRTWACTSGVSAPFSEIGDELHIHVE